MDKPEYGTLFVIIGFILGVIIMQLVRSKRKTITEVVRDDNGRIMQIVEMEV